MGIQDSGNREAPEAPCRLCWFRLTTLAYNCNAKLRVSGSFKKVIQPLVPQNVIVFGDKVFEEVIKLKSGH